MKCKSCNCQVSSDFKYAFTKNCCPKCGEPIMIDEVKDLYSKMEVVLVKNNNDIGDLAVWFVDTYLLQPNMESLKIDPAIAPTEELEQEIVKEEAVQPKPVRKPPVKVQKTNQNKEYTLLAADRTSVFTKRAGVDKIKYETLVKDIQGLQSTASIEEQDDMVESDYQEFDATPLSSREIESVVGLFEEPEKAVDFTEIQKLQKLEQLASTGSVGKIRRSP